MRTFFQFVYILYFVVGNSFAEHASPAEHFARLGRVFKHYWTHPIEALNIAMFLIVVASTGWLVVFLVTHLTWV